MDTVKKWGRGVVNAGLFLIKLPLQLAGRVKRPEIFIDSLENNRYAVYLSVALASSYVIEVRIRDLLYFYRYLPLDDFLFKTVVLLPGKKPVSPLYLSRERGELFPAKQRIVINGDYYSPQGESEALLVMPYFAHPKFYRNRLHFKPPGCQAGARSMRVFFCGTVDKESYSRNFRFPILNRFEIMEYIMEHFSGEISNRIDGPRKAMTIVFTDETRDVVEKHAFTPARYFEALRNADFFIAPPGWVMPHCHNIVEAMTAGTIPITNYAGYFNPPLQSGINCLSFESYEDLDRTLRLAMNMTQEEVDSLRRGTMEYYERHLKPSAFGATFRRCWKPSTQILVNNESEDYGLNLDRGVSTVKN